MRRLGQKWSGPVTVKPHPMHDGRRVPIKSLIRKLHIQAYDLPAPFQPKPLLPSGVWFAAETGGGVPNQPVVEGGGSGRRGAGAGMQCPQMPWGR
jgi:hypothetical protein